MKERGGWKGAHRSVAAARGQSRFCCAPPAIILLVPAVKWETMPRQSNRPAPMPPSPALRPLSTAAAVLLSAAAGAALHHTRHGNSTAPSPAAAPGAAAAATNARPGSATAQPAMPTRESLAALSPEAQITALAAALPQMEVADLLPLVEHLLKARGVAPDAQPDLISPLLRALFTRWAALDAASMMAFVESGPLHYDYGVRHLAVLALVEVRGLTALEEVRAKSPGLAREAAREMLLRQPQQLEALLPFLKAGSYFYEKDRVLENGLTLDVLEDTDSEIEAQIAKVLSPVSYLVYAMEMGLPTEDALNKLNREVGTEEVLKSLKTFPPGTRRDQILSTWLLSKVPQWDALIDKETDYTFFRREYEAMAEGPARSALNSRYATLRALENPDAALQWAHTLPDARQRFEAVTTICASLFMGTNAGNTFLGFYGREGDAAERLTRQFADAWMAAPEEAAKAPHIYDLYPFREWHIKDPAASEAWLATVPNPELRKVLVACVDIPAAARLQLLPDSVTRIQAVAAGALFSRPFIWPNEIAKELAALRDNGQTTIPAPLLEAALLHHLTQSRLIGAEWEALSAAERHALSAAFIRHAANPLPPAMTGHLNLSALAMPDAAGSGSNSFAASPDGETKTWLTLFNSLPPAERSLGACYEAGAAYVKMDETAASQWMESLPPGAERDAATTALVEHLVKPGESQDGEAAFAWAAAMSGETERSRYTAEAARAWAAEDPAATRAAVEASALPAAEKSALLQSIPEGGTQ